MSTDKSVKEIEFEIMEQEKASREIQKELGIGPSKSTSVRKIEIELAKIERSIKEATEKLGIDRLSRDDREKIVEDSKTISSLEVEYTSKLVKLRELNPNYKIRIHFCQKCKEIIRFKKWHYIHYISRGGFGEMASSDAVIRRGLHCTKCEHIIDEEESNKRGLEPEKDEE